METRAHMNWNATRVLILGLGVSGLAAARWLARRGALVRVADQSQAPSALVELRASLPEVAVHLGDWSADDFAWAQVVGVSPGVPLAHPMIRELLARGVPVWSDVEVVAQALPETAKIIAITGSNGKSTVTSMVAAMCAAAGLRTRMAGNIGIPVLQALDEAPDTEIFVLELSSFQLEAAFSLRPAAATVLNLSEDHLDRYADMAAYAAAKARIYRGSAAQIVNRDDAASAALALSGIRQLGFGLQSSLQAEDFNLRDGNLYRGETRLLAATELRITGSHNVANALAAWALCHAIGLPDAALAQAMREFRGLPHRVEWVAQIAGVDFYDDSKGTNVGATEAALKGMGKPLVLIAGGEGKGQDFSPLLAALQQCNARAVIQIGRDGAQSAKAVAGAGVPVLRAQSMQDAVSQAFDHAQPGDAVLLSPACASFDMFDNYAHRAQVFVAAVRQLEQRGAA